MDRIASGKVLLSSFSQRVRVGTRVQKSGNEGSNVYGHVCVMHSLLRPLLIANPQRRGMREGSEPESVCKDS
jgi:hypothetical protein